MHRHRLLRRFHQRGQPRFEPRGPTYLYGTVPGVLETNDRRHPAWLHGSTFTLKEGVLRTRIFSRNLTHYDNYT